MAPPLGLAGAEGRGAACESSAQLQKVFRTGKRL
jgi:hypothetical protein